MNAENMIRHLRVLWRTDRIIADIRLTHLLTGLGLRAFAGLVAAFGVLLFELAGYFALVQVWNAIASALLLGALNLAFAGALLLLASRPPKSRDLTLATEVHNSAIEALQQEARHHQPWEGAIATLLPLLTPIAINAIRRSRSKRAAPSE